MIRVKEKMKRLTSDIWKIVLKKQSGMGIKDIGIITITENAHESPQAIWLRISAFFLFYKSLKVFATTTPLPFMPGSKVAVVDFFKTLKTEFRYLLLPQNLLLHFSYRTFCLL